VGGSEADYTGENYM